MYWLCALAALGFQPGCLSGAIEANPYLSITERNPFGLKPPPPPASEDPTPVAAPRANVKLTGIVTMFGPPKALLEVIELEGGKPGQPVKSILTSGQRSGSVELLSIDVAKNQVRIRNGPVETNLSFEIAKASTPAGPPGPGVMARPGPFTPSALPTAYASNPAGPGAPNAAGGPTIVGPNAAGASGVTVLGGTSSAATPVAGSKPTMTPLPNAGAPVAPSVAAPNAAGSAWSVNGPRVLPTRRPRLDVPAPPVPAE